MNRSQCFDRFDLQYHEVVDNDIDAVTEANSFINNRQSNLSFDVMTRFPQFKRKAGLIGTFEKPRAEVCMYLHRCSDNCVCELVHRCSAWREPCGPLCSSVPSVVKSFYCKFSKIPAAPMPPPTHMVTTPYFPFRRFSSRR